MKRAKYKPSKFLFILFKISPSYSIYLKSQLVRDLKEIRKDTKLNSKGITNNENPFSLATKDEDVNELIKILMTFSYAFFNKDKFSAFHTQVMRECE